LTTFSLILLLPSLIVLVNVTVTVNIHDVIIAHTLVAVALSVATHAVALSVATHAVTTIAHAAATHAETTIAHAAATTWNAASHEWHYWSISNSTEPSAKSTTVSTEAIATATVASINLSKCFLHWFSYIRVFCIISIDLCLVIGLFLIYCPFVEN
jgi:hypothetical protein